MLLNLNNHSSEPLYAQIIRQVRSFVLNGSIPANAAIPSIRDLAHSHQVSIVTVQKAYEELVKEGLLLAKRGKGYFVAEIQSADLTLLAKERCEEALQKPIATALTNGVRAEDIRDIVNKIISDIASKHLRENDK